MNLVPVRRDVVEVNDRLGRFSMQVGSVGYVSGSEAGSYLRLIDACITQLMAQGPSMTCNESKEEEEKGYEPRAS